MYEVANLKVLILDNLVSQGTLGIQSLSEAKALLMDCVLRRSFLFEPTPSGCCKFNFDFLVTEDEGVELEAKLTLEAEVLLQNTINEALQIVVARQAYVFDREKRH